MGKATSEGIAYLLHKEKGAGVQASVTVRDPKSNTYYHDFAKYGVPDDDHLHVEEKLFHSLEHRFKSNLKEIPACSTIIFVCRWSPCKKCTKETIPNFLDRINLCGRSLIFKFRFEWYATTELWPKEKLIRSGSGQFLWGSREEADAEYNKLTRKYGTYGHVDDGFFLGDNEVETRAVRVKEKLVFSSAQEGTKTSKIFFY